MREAVYRSSPSDATEETSDQKHYNIQKRGKFGFSRGNVLLHGDEEAEC